MMHKIKDIIRNKYLRIHNLFFKNILRIKFGAFKLNYDLNRLALFDDFHKHNTDVWKIKKDSCECWEIDPSLVSFSKTGLLLKQDGNKSSEIESNYIFSNGIYEFNIELPMSKYINPKIELVAKNHLPNIIIFDAFTDNTGLYNNNIYNNIIYGHYGLNEKTIGYKKTLNYSMSELCYYYINLKLKFFKHKVVFYQNNYKVREITDPNVLKYLTNQIFKIKISNHPSMSNDDKSLFRIRNFSYYKHKYN